LHRNQFAEQDPSPARDQMHWPGAVEVAIESIETADFLSPEEKRDILYNNASRFLRLTPEQIAKQQRGE